MPGGALCSHLLLGCPPAVCELRVGTLLSIDPEKWRVGRENVETGGKRTGSGKESTRWGAGAYRSLGGKKKNGRRRLPAAAFVRSTYQCAGMPSVGKAWEVTFVNGASEHREHLEALQQSHLIFCIQEIILCDCKTRAGVSGRASGQAFTFFLVFCII